MAGILPIRRKTQNNQSINRNQLYLSRFSDPPFSIGARIPPEFRIAMAASPQDPLVGFCVWNAIIASVIRFPKNKEFAISEK